MEVIDWNLIPTFVLVICLLYLFVFIGAAASDYFCVNISTAAFHLPTSIAAILLSLANASPDLFSTFNAATNDGLNLAVGELIGSAAFVTTFIAGVIGLMNPSMLHASLFVKNLSLFIVLLVFVDIFIEFKSLPLAFSLLSLFYYLVYLMFILRHQNEIQSDDVEDPSTSSYISEPLNRQYSSESFLDRHYQSMPLLLPSEDDIPFFVEESSISNSRLMSILKRIMYVVTFPINLILRFSCPVVYRNDELSDEDSFTMSINDLSWRASTIRRKCQGFFGTLFVISMIFIIFEDVLPFVRITIILSILLALGVSLIFDQLPLQVVLIFGVIISACIVQNSANVMVTLLKLLCDRLQLSQGIVGLSVFALGNSLGDLITNLTLAKMGHTQIAYAATLTSPVLCLSVGLGASTLYLNIKNAEQVWLDPTIVWMLRLLIINLVIFLVLMKVYRYQLNRTTSLYLIISYFTILTTAMILGQINKSH